MAAQLSDDSPDSTHSNANIPSSIPDDSDDGFSSQHHHSTSPTSDPLCYSRALLLHLSKSPLVAPPERMPVFLEWFGEWFEPQKTHTDTLSLAARPRYRRDADDPAEPPPRETTSRPLRATFSQATQMGNFRHQSSLQSLKLDTGSPVDKDRDRDGNERLRSLSDRYDRDRDRLRSAAASNELSTLAGIAASPASATSRRDREREPAPHLSARDRQPSSTSLSGTAARREPPARTNGTTNGTVARAAPHERTATLTTKELTEARNDRSDDWRRGWEDRERTIPRERNGGRSRSRDRGWETAYRDGDKRSRSREPRGDEKRAWGASRDRDPWGGRGATAEDEHRRKEEEAPMVVPLRSTRRERDEKDRKKDRDRDRGEREPAWMDDWAPETPVGGGSGFGKGAGEMDKLQAWKKSMKEKEQGKDGPVVDDLSIPDPKSSANGSPGDDGEWETVTKKTSSVLKSNGVMPNGAPPGLQQNLPSAPAAQDPAIVSSRFPPPPADPAILAVANGVSKPSLPPSNGVVEGQSISLQSLGLPAPTPQPEASSPVQTQDSTSIFQALFNTNPPVTKPAEPVAEVRPTPSIDAKPTAQNVFASFLNESRHPAKTNGTSVKSPGAESTEFSSTSTPVSATNSTLTNNASSRSTTANSMPMNLGNASSAGGSGGRTSKFAKFFQNPATPKDEGPPQNSMNGMQGSASNQMHQQLQHQQQQQQQQQQHQSQQSLGGNRDAMASLNAMGLGPNQYGPSSGGGVNGMFGVGPGMGGRIASPTQHMSSQQQQQLNNLMGGGGPPRLGGGADALAGLFANAERVNGGMGVPGGQTGGTMEGLLAALDASARGGQPPSRNGSRFPPQQLNKPVNGAYNMLQGQQLSGMPSQFGQQQQQQQQLPPQQMFSPGLGDVGTGDRFVADNMVPGLRPPRTRESSLSLGQGMYGAPELDERELARQLQNMHFNGMQPQGLPPPPPQHQQIFDQRQHQHQLAQARQQQQQQQTLYANQGQPPQANRAALAGMMGMGGVGGGMGRPGGGPTPSPIGNQNPMAAAMQQRGAQMGMGMGGGFPGGLGGMRSPQDLGGMRQQDVSAMLGGQPRTPQELVHAGLLRGGNAGDMNGPSPFQQQQQQQQFGVGVGGGRPNGGFGVGVPNVGAPGTADYALHSQQLQAARASAAAQQQAQMMHHLGMRPPQQQQQQQQRGLVDQQQQRGMLPPPHMMGPMGGPLMGDYGNGGGVGGGGLPPPHLQGGGGGIGAGGGGMNQSAEQFLQLFLGSGGLGGGGGGGARDGGM